MATDEILPVYKIGRADGEWGCICPHCGLPMFFAQDEIDDVRGSQYQHTTLISFFTGERCDGWIDVDGSAGYARRMFDQGEP